MADDKRIDVQRTARAYRDLEATILSLAPSRLTLLDATGTVLRAKDMTESEAVDDAKSPEGTDLQVLAKLLAEAYEKGTKSYAPLLEASMSFIERQGQRLAQMERDIERLRLHNAKLQAELLAATAAPQAEESDGGIMGSLVAGMLQAQSGADVVQMKGKGK
jgi:hypothetical protein